MTDTKANYTNHHAIETTPLIFDKPFNFWNNYRTGIVALTAKMSRIMQKNRIIVFLSVFKK